MLYSPPTHLRMDSGFEFIAHALQESCKGSGYSTTYIPRGLASENARKNGRVPSRGVNPEARLP